MSSGAAGSREAARLLAGHPIPRAGPLRARSPPRSRAASRRKWRCGAVADHSLRGDHAPLIDDEGEGGLDDPVPPREPPALLPEHRDAPSAEPGLRTVAAFWF